PQIDDESLPGVSAVLIAHEDRTVRASYYNRTKDFSIRFGSPCTLVIPTSR
ncbi:unnamed protein product, partial [Allacma fusca]